MSEQLYRKYAACQNCKKIQGCKNNSHSYKCGDFELVGGREPKPKKSKDLCSGCYNTHYDYGVGLKQSGGKGCWSYKDAKVVLSSNIYSLNQRPPYSLGWALSCYRRR